jgi:peptide deformylase
MAVLKLTKYPNPILSKVSEPVSHIGVRERRLIQDMIETMYQSDGVGLAAPQVGVSKRIIVVSPDFQKGEEEVWINPEIIEASKNEEAGIEGCLSLPGVSGEIHRARKIRFKARDVDGAVQVRTFENFAARVVQHEVDHLNGVVIIDRLDFRARQALLTEYQRL